MMTTHTMYVYERRFRRMIGDQRHSDGRVMFRTLLTFKAHEWRAVRNVYLRMRRSGLDVTDARFVVAMLAEVRPVRSDRQPSPKFASAGQP